MRIRYCACCNCEIREDERAEYFKILDNNLQIKFFETNDENIFCSQECICKALSVERFDFNETNDDDSEYSNEIVEEDFNPDKEVDE